VLVLGAFVAGLVLADLASPLPGCPACSGTRARPRVQVGLGLVTGLASLTLGVLILTGVSDVVPPLVH
jgi:hypothetical protein